VAPGRKLTTSLHFAEAARDPARKRLLDERSARSWVRDIKVEIKPRGEPPNSPRSGREMAAPQSQDGIGPLSANASNNPACSGP